MQEVGIYRVSGSASDLARLKKAFESSKYWFFFVNSPERIWFSWLQVTEYNSHFGCPLIVVYFANLNFFDISLLTDYYEAEQLLKDVDIHSVTGIFKAFLRELPETLFTDILYRRFIETFNKFSSINEADLNTELQSIFGDVPTHNKTTIIFILDHLLR